MFKILNMYPTQIFTLEVNYNAYTKSAFAHKANNGLLSLATAKLNTGFSPFYCSNYVIVTDWTDSIALSYQEIICQSNSGSGIGRCECWQSR